MRTVNDYIDLAIERQKLSSLNKLNFELRLTGNTVFQWKYGKCFPSDPLMVQLADLAGIPREEALLDLHTWKAKDEASRDTWISLRSKLAAVAAAVFLACTLGAPGSAHAAEHVRGNLYIMETTITR